MAPIPSLAIYFPGEVTACLTTGKHNFIGAIDDHTVLKYPHVPGDSDSIELLGIEAKILHTIGPHRNIIGFKGITRDGLLLERAHCGSVAEYLEENEPDLERRLLWARQASDALCFVHKQGVLHRNICVHNFLLDAYLNIKLSHFRGQYTNGDGRLALDGQAIERIKSSMPRRNVNDGNTKTEIFAFGSAFYYMLTNHEPFPDLDPQNDGVQIASRFEQRLFPTSGFASLDRIIHQCWAGTYDFMAEVRYDLRWSIY